MATPKNEQADGSDNMIGTLLILFFANVLSDFCIHKLNWHWVLLMAATVALLYIFKAMMRSQKKSSAGTDDDVLHKN